MSCGPSVAELDDFLEEGTLREVKVQFWKRYKVRYPVEVTHRITCCPVATEKCKSISSLSTTYGSS